MKHSQQWRPLVGILLFQVWQLATPWKTWQGCSNRKVPWSSRSPSSLTARPLTPSPGTYSPHSLLCAAASPHNPEERQRMWQQYAGVCENRRKSNEVWASVIPFSHANRKQFSVKFTHCGCGFHCTQQALLKRKTELREASHLKWAGVTQAPWDLISKPN